MLLSRLPEALENVDHLIERRTRANTTKELWRSLYQDCFWYAMPTRETFSWHTEGQFKNRVLYDSTLQESTYTAANTLTALLFPSWSRWAELAPGGAIKPDEITPEMIAGLQDATEMIFSFLNTSNFGTVIGEAAQDLMIGTCALSFEEGPSNDQPFIFSPIPLPVIEIEEGPQGSVETTWMERKIKARNILRTYPGMLLTDLSVTSQDLIRDKPDAEITVIQGEVYHPEDKNYYGVVLELAVRQIVWRYNYGVSCPTIVGRATKVAGETYGRGRVMLALSDARTLDKMQEFVLRHSALQIAGVYTGISDGVFNPYTARIAPNVILPVASNDSSNPSLRALEVGGDLRITEAMMNDLRQRVRRTMLGPEPSEGAVKSATEINISDRNRLWAMNGEFSRIQAEVLAKILARAVFILQKKGLIPKFSVNGQQVAIKYTSPFSKSQAAEDVMALQQTLGVLGQLGPEVIHLGIKTEDLPGWVGRTHGVPEKLLRNKAEQADLANKAAAAASAQANLQQSQAGAAAAPSAPGPMGG